MPTLSPQEWKYLYALRDDMADDEDRHAIRKVIRRAEELEMAMRRIQRASNRAMEGDEREE